MHLVKWIRKNERKIMTFVVIFIMIAFVGGTAFQQIMGRLGRNQANEPVVLYYEDGKITRNDIVRAQTELRVLASLGMDRFLNMIGVKGQLLGQLLFPDSRMAAAVSDMLKQSMLQGRFQASVSDIDKFFNQASGMPEIYWLLLQTEAKNTGCVMSLSRAKTTLKQIVPQITENNADAGQLVNLIIERLRIPEEKIIRTFADLLGVLTYAAMTTTSEDVTIDQIKANIARKGEKIDAEFVKIETSGLIDNQPEPDAEELDEQFSRYKNFTEGDITQDNVYGFGYKLPAMVKLEYLIVKLDDVRKLVDKPTPEETEEYYQLNSYRFQYDEPVDPNDPESQTITKTRSYAEVSRQIQQILIQTRTDQRANMILNEAIELTEKGYSQLDRDTATSAELKEAAGDYSSAAAKLNDKYGIKVYTAKTGSLTAEEVTNSAYLGKLQMVGQSRMPIPLTKIVFAVEEVAASRLGRFDVSRPKMWENIGPAKDSFGTIIAIVRVIDGRSSAEPEQMDISFSKKTAVLDEPQAPAEDNIYSIKEAVIRDVKLLKVMQAAASRAQELAAMVTENGWDEALEKYNKRYTATTVELETLSAQTRISLRDVSAVKMLLADDASQETYIKTMLKNKILLDKLYSLLPAGETETVNPGPPRSIVEFRPGASYYVIKKVSRTVVNKRDYFMEKNQLAYMLDGAGSESLGIIHYTPENIFKRMNYRPAGPQEPASSDAGDQE